MVIFYYEIDYQDFEEGDVVECFVGGDQDKEDFST
jgi:hypothetical protein